MKQTITVLSTKGFECSACNSTLHIEHAALTQEHGIVLLGKCSKCNVEMGVPLVKLLKEFDGDKARMN